MKRTFQQTMVSLLLGVAFLCVGSAQAQYYDNNFYDPSETSYDSYDSSYDACDPCYDQTYDQGYQAQPDVCYDPCGYDQWDDSCWDWDDCSWNCCQSTPSRVYVGPIFFHRRVDIMLDECTTANNIYGLENDAKLRGNNWGVNFGYEYREFCNLYARADFRWTGGTLKGIPRHHASDWQLEGRIGYTWGEACPSGYGLTPYVGIGYYWVERKFTFVDFKGKYHAWYIPIGIYGDIEVLCDLTAGIDFTFAPYFDSKLDSHSTVFNLPNKGLSDRYMWRVTIPLRWQVCPEWGFEVSVEPFWQQLYFNKVCLVDDQENTANSRPGIPKWREDLWGSKFLVAFKF